jgi:DNA-binding transcriptional MerR regulator
VSSYTPGQTAEKSGFSLDTLRYYEKIGLLANVARTTAGRRSFTEDDLNWLTMVRCLRDTGMPVAEMVRYAELAREGDHTLAERMAILEAHDRRVEDQIAGLRERQRRIQHKIRWYREVTA